MTLETLKGHYIALRDQFLFLDSAAFAANQDIDFPECMGEIAGKWRFEVCDALNLQNCTSQVFRKNRQREAFKPISLLKDRSLREIKQVRRFRKICY